MITRWRFTLHVTNSGRINITIISVTSVENRKRFDVHCRSFMYESMHTFMQLLASCCRWRQRWLAWALSSRTGQIQIGPLLSCLNNGIFRGSVNGGFQPEVQVLVRTPESNFLTAILPLIDLKMFLSLASPLFVIQTLAQPAISNHSLEPRSTDPGVLSSRKGRQNIYYIMASLCNMLGRMLNSVQTKHLGAVHKDRLIRNLFSGDLLWGFHCLRVRFSWKSSTGPVMEFTNSSYKPTSSYIAPGMHTNSRLESHVNCQETLCS